MKIERKLVIGQTEYSITVDADNAADFFKTMSFFDSLPKVGPNGETDLVVTYRTPKDYEYYSIVSQQAGMEFKFGQHKERPGSLFAKGWESLYKSEGQEEGEQATSGVGLGAPVAAAPATTQAAPKAVGLGAAPKAAAPAKTQTQAAPAATPQVQNQAQAILSKFGI